MSKIMENKVRIEKSIDRREKIRCKKRKTKYKHDEISDLVEKDSTYFGLRMQ